MLVKYNAESGVKIIALVDLDEASVKEKGSVRGQVVMLVPGWNEIPFELWPNAEPTMEMEFKQGVFEYKCKEVEEPVEGSPTEIKTVRKQLALSEVHSVAARKIIEECMNIRDIERWKEDSKLSSELRNIADIQYNKITKFGEK